MATYYGGETIVATSTVYENVGVSTTQDIYEVPSGRYADITVLYLSAAASGAGGDVSLTDTDGTTTIFTVTCDLDGNFKALDQGVDDSVASVSNFQFVRTSSNFSLDAGQKITATTGAGESVQIALHVKEYTKP